MTTAYLDVTQECNSCGARTTVRYRENGWYDFLNTPCECESTFSPVDGEPTINQWLESLPKKTDLTCRFCGSPLYESELEQYKYQCFECDEDFYGFEQEWR